MSDQLYSTRLRWHAGAGVAKLHGRAAPLTHPPVICGAPVQEIDYAPEIACREIRPRACDPRRDMTPAEIAEADALLRLLVSPLSRLVP